MVNGSSEVSQLTQGQLAQLRKLITPYLVQMEALEKQANAARKTINDIAGAYLAGLGVPADLSVDLVTGDLTPVKVPES